MSTIEENAIIAPWVGPTCCRNSLSVVVLSSNNNVIENISEALLDVHAMGDFRWKLVVLRSLCLEDIAKQSELTGKLSIDFVIVAVDTSRLFCIDWASKVLEQVHPDLRIRRVVLVNATDSPIHAMAVNTSEIITFCSENRLDMLTADVSKQEDANFLAQRLLKYIEVSLGVNTGIPNINI
ncbi:uncharacterized protein LOC120631383 [Pararge aegeria]|uniref:Jg1731 protein n=2 Tax=Pararge aegeria TaxID=116150 RepID=A0A8S4SPC5_9NEOP|nr:uncharacterized protein LOC120631383 [Pararge aegeria]CAH2269211.1 jg1731 [Pararge aegeria aegeria]